VVRSAPVANPAAGEYHATQNVTLTATSSTAICYTVDNTIPACATAVTCATGTVYNAAVAVTLTTTIKSAACYADNTTGPVSTDTYTLTCAIAAVSNGTVSAYPNCVITCNPAYIRSGNSCVYNGGGGGGGGGGSSGPVSLTSTATITPTNGGTVTLTNSDGSRVQFIAPANAVSGDTIVTITTVISGSSYTPP
jgi:hypothetical protein